MPGLLDSDILWVIVGDDFLREASTHNAKQLF